MFLLNDLLFGKELFIRFTMHVFPERLSICMSFFAFWCEGRVWDLIVLIPDHFILFTMSQSFKWPRILFVCEKCFSSLGFVIMGSDDPTACSMAVVLCFKYTLTIKITN